MRFGLKIGKHAKFSHYACKHCKVILCDGCWDLWDHENEKAASHLPPPAKALSSAAVSSPAGATTTDRSLPCSAQTGCCPDGHPLRWHVTYGGLKCDICEGSLEGECLSCSGCDYDLCQACSSEPPDERGQRHAKRASSEPAADDEALPPAKRPKATRLPSKAAVVRRANKAARQVADNRAANKARTEAATKARMASVRKARARPQGSGKRSRSSGEDTCEPRSQRPRRS